LKSKQALEDIAGVARRVPVALAGIATVIGAVWATTPAPVSAPAAMVRAQCFGLLQLPYVADDAEDELARRNT
jgi:hypothetical protein